MIKIKQNFFLLVIAVILIALIIARLTLPEGSYSWINTINYAGLVMAVVSLFFSMCNEYKHRKRFYSIAGFLTFFILILIVIGVLILTNIIVLNSKVNDFIMLLTLLISLPSQLYIDLMGQYLKK